MAAWFLERRSFSAMSSKKKNGCSQLTNLMFLVIEENGKISLGRREKKRNVLLSSNFYLIFRFL